MKKKICLISIILLFILAQFCHVNALETDEEYSIPTIGAEYVNGADATDGYHWYVYGFKIYKHDIASNSNTLVYQFDRQEKESYIGYFYNHNTIYIMYIKDKEPYIVQDKAYIVGVSLKTGEEVFKGEFDVPEVGNDEMQSFAVNSKGIVYITYKKTGIKVFSEDGHLIYDRTPIEDETGKNYIYIKGISPNDKALFIEEKHRMYDNLSYFQSVHEGQQKLNEDGSFAVNLYTFYGRNIQMGVYAYCPNWKFLDDEGIYAADQYGRIAKFNYDLPITDESQMGISREFVFDAKSGVSDYTFDPYPADTIACVQGGYAYIMGKNNNIYKVNLETLKCEQYINTGLSDYKKADGLTYFNNALYLKLSNEEVMKKIELNQDNLIDVQNIVYTNKDSSTGSRTKSDIIAKYKQIKPTFDYQNTIYQEAPSPVSPYYEGSLKQEVITDTLNMLNYYRWLVGVDEIEINTEKMSRSQKAALLMKVNGQISHDPTKPADMADDFFAEAHDGCSAKYQVGDIYSGNVGYGDMTPYQAIQDYVSDSNNVSANSTGHRQSMLDPKATGVSFGYCDRFSAVSIYYDDNKDISKAKFYSFPSPGYFPNTEMKVGELWSIYLPERTNGTVKVKFTYKEKEYQGYVYLESSYPVVNFKMPDELVNLLGGENKTIPADTTIGVEVYGMQDENLNTVTYKYTVDFCSTVEVMKGDVNKDSKVTLYDALQILKQAILKGNLSDEELYIMDYNDDGKVTLYDALKFLQKAILG